MRIRTACVLFVLSATVGLSPLAAVTASAGPIAEISEFQIAYFALKDTHTLGEGAEAIRKGQLIWFKAAPAGDSQEARMENGETRAVNPAEFAPVGGGSAPAKKP